ncbi:MAG: hypothetical protein ACM3PT_01015 [Deltaproteobacteria bacterium]
MILLYSIIVLAAPFASFIISVFFNRNKTRIDTAFSIMTGYIFLTELLGTLLGYFTQYSNFFIYNFYCLFFPLLNFSLYYKLIDSRRMKKRIIFMAYLLVLVFIADNYFSKNFFTEQQFHTYLISLFFLIYIISFHLLQIMESDSIQYFNKSKSFWISLGLLLFSVPFLPVMLTFKFMTVNYEVRNIVTSLLILSLHTCFIYASLGTKHK